MYTNKITINLNQIKNIFEAVSNKLEQLDATLCTRCQSLTGMCSVLAHPPAVNVWRSYLAMRQPENFKLYQLSPPCKIFFRLVLL